MTNHIINGISEWPASSRLQTKIQHYVRGADQAVLEQMRLTVFEVVVGVLRSKEFQNDIPKAVETACKVSSSVVEALCNHPLATRSLSLTSAQLATDAVIASFKPEPSCERTPLYMLNSERPLLLLSSAHDACAGSRAAPEGDLQEQAGSAGGAV